MVTYCWQDNSEKPFFELGWEKAPNWECMFCHRNNIYVDDINMGGKKQNMAPVWKKLMKTADFGEPPSSLNPAHLGCTQRERKPNGIVIDENTKMFGTRFSAGAAEQSLGWEKLNAKKVAWSYEMEGHARKCVERYCELANKKVKQFFKISSLCLDEHRFKQEELELVGELSQVCSQLVLKCSHVARVGRPDVQWLSTNLQEQSQIWTEACGRRIGNIDFRHAPHKWLRQYCHVGKTA